MFASTGLKIFERYLSAKECGSLLDAVGRYREHSEPPLIRRPEAVRSLVYKVIDGDQIHDRLPEFEHLYRHINLVVSETCRLDLVPLANRTAGVNINITPPGGEYRRHYDRNSVTAILFLNTVAGGETEVFPNYRLHLGPWKATKFQQRLDRLLQLEPVIRRFGNMVAVAPKAGKLLVMRGDKCLHGVRPVEGDADRVNVVMTFDSPGAAHPQQENLDPYLYSVKPSPSFDPNYEHHR